MLPIHQAHSFCGMPGDNKHWSEDDFKTEIYSCLKCGRLLKVLSHIQFPINHSKKILITLTVLIISPVNISFSFKNIYILKLLIHINTYILAFKYIYI